MTAPTTVAPAQLLAEIADALNKLRDLGANPDIRYGAVLTDHGYVLAGETGWEPKLKVHNPHYQPGLDPDDT